MRIPRVEDVSLLLLSDLARRNFSYSVPLSDIARRHGLTVPFLKKIARCLVKAGLIKSREGSHGGYRLAKIPNHITVWQVVEATGSETRVNLQTYLSGNICPVNRTCLPQNIRLKVNRSIEMSLSSLTLADLIADSI